MDYSKEYNYHSHTFRCGHAANVPDGAYILKAVECGYKKYGVTDHVPVHPIFFGDSYVRMHDSDRYDYYDSIEKLKELYKGTIDVYLGFEAEYDEIIDAYLCELRENCDYMIMGQHYVLNKDIRYSIDYPIEYAKKVCAGIESGIFDIVAHPDIFMQYRDGIPESQQEEYFYKALEASRMICMKAKEYNIPLEINLGATHVYDKKISESGLNEEQMAIFNGKHARYPTNLFWAVACQIGNSAVVGIDAHYPEEIKQKQAKLAKINTYIDLSKLNILENYDPVVARENNPKLQEAFERTKRNATSVEGRLVESYLSYLLDAEKVNKNKVKTDLIRTLRELPNNRKFAKIDDFDGYTMKKREALVKVIKEGTRKISPGPIDGLTYIKELKAAIDKHYSRSSIIELDYEGNIIGVKNKFKK